MIPFAINISYCNLTPSLIIPSQSLWTLHKEVNGSSPVERNYLSKAGYYGFVLLFSDPSAPVYFGNVNTSIGISI